MSKSRIPANSGISPGRTATLDAPVEPLYYAHRSDFCKRLAVSSIRTLPRAKSGRTQGRFGMRRALWRRPVPRPRPGSLTIDANDREDGDRAGSVLPAVPGGAMAPVSVRQQAPGPWLLLADSSPRSGDDPPNRADLSSHWADVSPFGAEGPTLGRTARPSGRTFRPLGRTVRPPGRKAPASGQTPRTSGRTIRPWYGALGRWSGPSARLGESSARRGEPSPRAADYSVSLAAPGTHCSTW